jgi:hypothetical protein
VPCSLLEDDRHFADAYCLQHQCSDDGGNMHLWNVSQLLQDYTTLYSRRLLSCITVYLNTTGYTNCQHTKLTVNTIIFATVIPFTSDVKVISLQIGLFYLGSGTSATRNIMVILLWFSCQSLVCENSMHHAWVPKVRTLNNPYVVSYHDITSHWSQDFF